MSRPQLPFLPKVFMCVVDHAALADPDQLFSSPFQGSRGRYQLFFLFTQRVVAVSRVARNSHRSKRGFLPTLPPPLPPLQLIMCPPPRLQRRVPPECQAQVVRPRAGSTQSISSDSSRFGRGRSNMLGSTRSAHRTQQVFWQTAQRKGGDKKKALDTVFSGAGGGPI